MDIWAWKFLSVPKCSIMGNMVVIAQGDIPSWVGLFAPTKKKCTEYKLEELYRVQVSSKYVSRLQSATIILTQSLAIRDTLCVCDLGTQVKTCISHHRNPLPASRLQFLLPKCPRTIILSATMEMLMRRKGSTGPRRA